MLTMCIQLESVALYKWMGNQRTSYREGKLKRDRYEKLGALGFVWWPKQMKSKPLVWESKYRELQLYKQKHGHINIPKVSGTPYQLQCDGQC